MARPRGACPHLVRAGGTIWTPVDLAPPSVPYCRVSPHDGQESP
ncbi:hypothetical protein HMPREF0682_2520 [Propionibacterium acidifaciens F0233]|uniref:Uncharacterized protein n=1 Tax=Propionibacterium acidifaciens F0233 TaxID=553198 RepID=U2Q8S9_9ACTN|nr:hypothetical protein HMPREF0682_2520 [Propionibacterium acidifaciens F0233]